MEKPRLTLLLSGNFVTCGVCKVLLFDIETDKANNPFGTACFCCQICIDLRSSYITFSNQMLEGSGTGSRLSLWLRKKLRVFDRWPSWSSKHCRKTTFVTNRNLERTQDEDVEDDQTSNCLNVLVADPKSDRAKTVKFAEPALRDDEEKMNQHRSWRVNG